MFYSIYEASQLFLEYGLCLIFFLSFFLLIYSTFHQNVILLHQLFSQIKSKQKNEGSVGLYTYPVLQAADILLYKWDLHMYLLCVYVCALSDRFCHRMCQCKTEHHLLCFWSLITSVVPKSNLSTCCCPAQGIWALKPVKESVCFQSKCTKMLIPNHFYIHPPFSSESYTGLLFGFICLVLLGAQIKLRKIVHTESMFLKSHHPVEKEINLYINTTVIDCKSVSEAWTASTVSVSWSWWWGCALHDYSCWYW